MGSCTSSSKEHEIDMYVNKYHKFKPIKTDINDYEVSKQ
jgi:hypothetical protein